jgi:hypothetical protein
LQQFLHLQEDQEVVSGFARRILTTNLQKLLMILMVLLDCGLISYHFTCSRIVTGLIQSLICLDAPSFRRYAQRRDLGRKGKEMWWWSFEYRIPLEPREATEIKIITW